MALCRLECPICQQTLLKNTANDEVDYDEQPFGTLDFALSGTAGQERRRYWRWSPVSTSCGHLFHKGCILQWFRSQRHQTGFSRLRGSCPTCRRPITSYNLVRIYLTPSSPELEDSPSPPSEHERVEDLSSRISELVAATDPPQQGGQTGNANELSNSGQLYNSFFSMNSHTVGPRNRRSSRDSMRRRLRLLRRETSYMNFNLAFSDVECNNPDCADIRSAFFILSREYKVLQRKLEVETEVSKMKSLLVASQQRDINQLNIIRRRRRARNLLMAAGVLLLIVLVSLVLTIVFAFWMKSMVSGYRRNAARHNLENMGQQSD